MNIFPYKDEFYNLDLLVKIEKGEDEKAGETAYRLYFSGLREPVQLDAETSMLFVDALVMNKGGLAPFFKVLWEETRSSPP